RNWVDWVVLRSDQDPELRGDSGIGRELAELRRGAPRLDAQEDEIHVAAFEDITFDHGRTDFHRKIVFRHERNNPSADKRMSNLSSLLESVPDEPNRMTMSPDRLRMSSAS